MISNISELHQYALECHQSASELPFKYGQVGFLRTSWGLQKMGRKSEDIHGIHRFGIEFELSNIWNREFLSSFYPVFDTKCWC